MTNHNPTASLNPKVIQPTEFTDRVCQMLWKAADIAGTAAVNALTVRPMIVSESWFVADGPCGFAWVNIKPANSRFAKYLTKQGLARKDSCAGGVCIWIHAFNQSMQRKQAYAAAFAGKLQEYGICAYSDSRMD